MARRRPASFDNSASEATPRPTWWTWIAGRSRVDHRPAPPPRSHPQDRSKEGRNANRHSGKLSGECHSIEGPKRGKRVSWLIAVVLTAFAGGSTWRALLLHEGNPNESRMPHCKGTAKLSKAGHLRLAFLISYPHHCCRLPQAKTRTTPVAESMNPPHMPLKHHPTSRKPIIG